MCPQVKELADAGWEIGAHTVSHRKLADQWAEEGDDAIVAEAVRANELFVKHLGKPPVPDDLFIHLEEPALAVFRAGLAGGDALEEGVEELDVLLLTVLALLVEELAGGPQLGEGFPPGGAGEDEPVVLARLNVADRALVHLVSSLIP